MNDDLSLHLAALKASTNVLATDVLRCLEQCRTAWRERKSVDPFWGRILVRSFFAWLESVYDEMAKAVAVASEQGVSPVAPPTLAAISRHVFELDAEGRAVGIPRAIPIDRRMRVVYPLFARIFDVDLPLPTKGQGWESFSRLLALRDRLTHPQSGKDLDIGSQELFFVIDAAAWHLASYTHLLAECVKQSPGSGLARFLADPGGEPDEGKPN